MFRKVAVAISGGIDSAVSALILKNKGYHVVGTFMRCWDEPDDNDNCTVNEDIESAKWICDRLDIPLRELNFVEEYWTNVFENMIADYNVGYTPNPDIACNEFIKFGCYHDYCMNKLKVDAVATGHYVRSSYGPFLENFDPANPVRLLKGIDVSKDQSFFLARISQKALQRTMFPVGGLTKKEVKTIAKECSLDKVLHRKESLGLCFVGPQNFKSFISRYVLDRPGKFVDVDTGEVVGEHMGIHHWTVGQRCLHRYVVVDKDLNNIVFVASNNNHAALFCHSLMLSCDRWITKKPEKMSRDRIFHCQFQYMRGRPLLDCTLVDMSDFPESGYILLDSKEPIYAAACGQYAVLYDGDECLGSARILNTGPSNMILDAAALSSETKAHR